MLESRRPLHQRVMKNINNSPTQPPQTDAVIAMYIVLDDDGHVMGMVSHAPEHPASVEYIPSGDTMHWLVPALAPAPHVVLHTIPGRVRKRPNRCSVCL
jgi:hypothetical protein